MAPWVLESNTASLGRTFTRPLGTNELGFYYDACFNMTAEMVSGIIIRSLTPEGDALMEYENVSKAWVALKQFYPLLGARTRGAIGTDAVHLAVSEKLLAQTDTNEIIFATSRDGEDSLRVVYNFMYGPQRSFYNTPARLLIVRHSNEPHHWYLATSVAHFITDTASATNYVRVLCDLLTFSRLPGIPDLEKRLAMIVPAEDLNPARQQTLSRQRWRFAIAGVIYSIRINKLQVSPSASLFWSPH